MRWIFAYCHGLHWEKGDVSLKALQRYGALHLRNKKIYVKNLEKKDWLMTLFKYIPSTSIYDLDELGCVNIKQLKNMYIQLLNNVIITMILNIDVHYKILFYIGNM